MYFTSPEEGETKWEKNNQKTNLLNGTLSLHNSQKIKLRKTERVCTQHQEKVMQ